VLKTWKGVGEMIASKNGVKWLYKLDKDKNPWNPKDEEGLWRPKNFVELNYELECYDKKEDGEDQLCLIAHRDGSFTIKKEYAWNGCTPKFGFFDILIGTPDGVVHKGTGKPKAYYATMIHDSLYQFIPVMPDDVPLTRKVADAFFLELLEREEFILRWIYWLAVRIFGSIAMRGRKSVTRKTNGYVIKIPPKSK
jgi:hypothetical protein